GRDNHFAELKDYEIISERMSILRDVNEYVGKFFSLDYIKRNVLRMTDKEIADMDEQIALEREQGLITDDSGGF
ncbi:MAG: portal protein, partial [Candidatus Peribacter sp.]|nr:portal protein [Candidatus Peribacter sp.]